MTDVSDPDMPKIQRERWTLGGPRQGCDQMVHSLRTQQCAYTFNGERREVPGFRRTLY